MKIRNGFVSNSSSSSFIVAVDPKVNKKGTVKIEMEVDLSSMGKHINSIEYLDEYFNYEYGYSKENIKNEPYIAKRYKAMKKAIENGLTVIAGSFCSESEDSFERMLCETGLPKKIEGVTIIENEAGY